LDTLFELKDVFIGIGLGHIFGNVGIVIGANFKTFQEEKLIEGKVVMVDKKKRKGNLAIGFTFIF